MSLANVAVATVSMAVLRAVVVLPLASYLTSLRAVSAYAPAGALARGAEAAPGEVPAPPEVPTGFYVLADVLVLGCAGLIAGLLGHWFVGVASRAKDWPGLIALMAAGLIAAAVAMP